MSRIVLVGESNPYGSSPEFALYPEPSGCSGHRLCHLILGMHRQSYLSAFERANLCDYRWTMSEAVQSAARLMDGGGRFVLLGSKVCAAFGVPFVPFTAEDEVLLRLPHPSGRCRAWSQPGAYLRARVAVRRFAPEVSHLIGVDSDGGDEC